jgi:hypothetical protein
LKNLDPSESPGPDGITSRLLKEVATEIASSITIIFNKSLAYGIYFLPSGKTQTLFPFINALRKI